MANHIAATIAIGRYDRRVESGPIVLYVAELVGETVHVRWVSDNFERVLGHDASACIVDPAWWINHLHPSDQAASLERRPQFPSIAQIASEYRFCHGDGGYRWISDHINIVTGEPGAPIQVVGALIDVTDRKDIKMPSDGRTTVSISCFRTAPVSFSRAKRGAHSRPPLLARALPASSGMSRRPASPTRVSGSTGFTRTNGTRFWRDFTACSSMANTPTSIAYWSPAANTAGCAAN